MRYTLILLISIVFFIVHGAATLAQDTLYHHNGEVLSIQVKEVNDKSIVFTYPGEFHLNRLSLNNVDKIVFVSGREQVFESNDDRGENATLYVEPDYVGNFLLIKDGESIPLEKQKVGIKTNASGGYRDVPVYSKTAYLVENAHSPVEINPGMPINIIVRMENTHVNPKEEINIFPLKSKKKKRTVRTLGSLTPGQSKSKKIPEVRFEAEPYGESSFMLTIPDLLPGEYAMNLAGNDLYFNLFRVLPYPK